MRKFIIKVILFGFWLMLIVFAGMFIPRILPDQNLHFALIDKHKRLQEINSPRIILVGGSNLSFGIDSKKIEEEFHKPVVNTSIHAGMGLKYIVEDILPYLKNGDIVIVSPEYDHFFGGVVWGYEPMISSIFAIPSNYPLLNIQNWKEIISAVPKEALRNLAKFCLVHYRRIFNEASIGIYDRNSFNAYGDVTAHYRKPPEKFEPNNIDPDFNPVALDMLEKLRRSVQEKRGKYFIAFPALNESSCALYPEKISLVQRELKKHGFKLLGTSERYCFDDSLYYNAKYHLTVEGVDKRTSLLIEDLQNALQLR